MKTMRLKIALISLLSLAVLVFSAAQRGGEAILTQTVASGGATITLVERVGSLANGSTDTFNVTVASTNAHDAFFVLTFTSAPATCSSSAQSLTDNKSGGSSTYTNQWSVLLFGGADCVQLWYLLNTATGITQLTFTMGTGNDLGGMLIYHANKSIAWTGVDQSSVMSSTLQSTPFASSSITTTQASSFIVGEVNIHIATYNSGAQNAYAATGSWTASALCDQSTSAPCINATSGKLDGGNGGILGGAYQIVTTTQSGLQFTGTNNGSANVYDNYPGIVNFY
jgi:hypothetical protein